MTRYNKKHEKKKEAPFKTHSRRTGKIILIVLALLISVSASFLYVAWNEQTTADLEEKRFRLLDCENMQKELDVIVKDTGKPIKHYDWRVIAYFDKGC